MVSASNISKYLFLGVFWYFLDLVVLFLSSFVVYPLFTYLHGKFFYAKFYPLYIHHISSKPVVGFPVLFLFLANRLMTSMYICWLFLVIYNVCIVHFLRMGLRGIIAINNSNGDSTSPWNITFWILTSAKLFHPVVRLTLQFFMLFSINVMTLQDILYSLIIPICRTISHAFLESIHVLFFCRWRCVDQCIVDLLFLWFHAKFFLFLVWTVHGLSTNCKFPP